MWVQHSGTDISGCKRGELVELGGGFPQWCTGLKPLVVALLQFHLTSKLYNTCHSTTNDVLIMN